MKKALVIIHLSSLDAYAEAAGSDKAFELAQRIRKRVDAFRGPVVVVDQGWPRSKFSKPRENLHKHLYFRNHVEIIPFEDREQDWRLFLERLRDHLLDNGVTNVELGGVWYSPSNPDEGAVGDAERVLDESKLLVSVNKDLVGTWPGIPAMGRRRWMEG